MLTGPRARVKQQQILRLCLIPIYGSRGNLRATSADNFEPMPSTSNNGQYGAKCFYCPPLYLTDNLGHFRTNRRSVYLRIRRLGVRVPLGAPVTYSSMQAAFGPLFRVTQQRLTQDENEEGGASAASWLGSSHTRGSSNPMPRSSRQVKEEPADVVLPQARPPEKPQDDPEKGDIREPVNKTQEMGHVLVAHGSSIVRKGSLVPALTKAFPGPRRRDF